jgi:hypothetical protein
MSGQTFLLLEHLQSLDSELQVDLQLGLTWSMVGVSTTHRAIHITQYHHPSSSYWIVTGGEHSADLSYTYTSLAQQPAPPTPPTDNSKRNPQCRATNFDIEQPKNGRHAQPQSHEHHNHQHLGSAQIKSNNNNKQTS